MEILYQSQKSNKTNLANQNTNKTDGIVTGLGLVRIFQKWVHTCLPKVGDSEGGGGEAAFIRDVGV